MAREKHRVVHVFVSVAITHMLSYVCVKANRHIKNCCAQFCEFFAPISRSHFDTAEKINVTGCNNRCLSCFIMGN